LTSEEGVETEWRALVPGVFHMNNPGQDLSNLQVDDVLIPKGQKEIAETVVALRSPPPGRFNWSTSCAL